MKIDLHIHAKEDPFHNSISYSMKDIIDKAFDKGIEVIAFTFHDKYFENKKIEKYAKERGILIIPGIEKTIEGKHVLIYNCKKEELKQIKKITDLKKIKRKEVLIGCPHPFFIGKNCLKNKLEENIELFDFIEYSWFHTKILNLNKKAVNLSKKYNKPLIATSDCHTYKFFGEYYTEIESEKRVDAVIRAIKKGKITKNCSPNLRVKDFIKTGIKVLLNP